MSETQERGNPTNARKGKAVSVLPGAARAPAPPRLRDLEDRDYAPVIEMIPVTRTSGFDSMRRLARAGLITAAAFVGGLFVFGASTGIDGAVVASGVLVVEGGAKAVQHPVGGALSEVLVSEGDVVERGEVVAKLDARVREAELMAIETTLANQVARLARLLAERDGLRELPSVEMPDFDILPREERGAILINESMQLQLREAAREGKREQLRGRIEQQKAQITANEERLVSSAREIEIVERELAGIRQLFEQDLVPIQRLSEKERTLAQLQSQRTEINAAIGAAQARIGELELQIVEIDQSLRGAITDQISDTRTSIAELVQRRIAAARRLEDTELRAPQAGTVHELAVRAAGEVIGPGQVAMQIIPNDDELVGEVRVRPSDIDQIFPGQETTIAFSAFDLGTTPQLSGHLVSISPDLVIDPTTGVGHYKVRLEADEGELERLGDLTLVPGMPIETFIRTGERTLLSFVTKPMRDQIRRSMR